MNTTGRATVVAAATPDRSKVSLTVCVFEELTCVLCMTVDEAIAVNAQLVKAIDDLRTTIDGYA